jgi:hypothetical protein
VDLGDRLVRVVARGAICLQVDEIADLGRGLEDRIGLAAQVCAQDRFARHDQHLGGVGVRDLARVTLGRAGGLAGVGHRPGGEHLEGGDLLDHAVVVELGGVRANGQPVVGLEVEHVPGTLAGDDVARVLHDEAVAAVEPEPQLGEVRREVPADHGEDARRIVREGGPVVEREAVADVRGELEVVEERLADRRRLLRVLGNQRGWHAEGQGQQEPHSGETAAPGVATTGHRSVSAMTSRRRTISPRRDSVRAGSGR